MFFFVGNFNPEQARKMRSDVNFQISRLGIVSSCTGIDQSDCVLYCSYYIKQDTFDLEYLNKPIIEFAVWKILKKVLLTQFVISTFFQTEQTKIFLPLPFKQLFLSSIFAL